MYPTGLLVEDFVFAAGRGELHVLNAPSPGATASLAIADQIVERLRETVN
jgi:L-2-hydroxyglutarate oxidase